MTRVTLSLTVDGVAATSAAALLAAHSGLSRGRIKDAMTKGAVWLRRGRGRRRRLRRATTELRSGDVLELFYDAELLARRPPPALCLRDGPHYSLWFKPAGLLTQGTDYGDHCSLERQAEQRRGAPRGAFVVHRLDREAAGLVLLAHDSAAAAKLSELFRDHRIIKRYRVRVLGDLAARGPEGVIGLPLNGRAAQTEYRVTGYDRASGTSTAEVQIRTGRLHQIRRHFEAIGYPVLGDSRYGSANAHPDGLQLLAYGLAFRCPFTGCQQSFELQSGDPPRLLR